MSGHLVGICDCRTKGPVKAEDGVVICSRCLLVRQVDRDLKPSNIDHPPHYAFGAIEPIAVIEDWKLGFCLGNAVKYIARAEHKGTPLDDLKKARWYLDREIARREKGGGQ